MRSPYTDPNLRVKKLSVFYSYLRWVGSRKYYVRKISLSCEVSPIRHFYTLIIMKNVVAGWPKLYVRGKRTTRHFRRVYRNPAILWVLSCAGLDAI